MIVANGNPFDDVESAVAVGPAYSDIVLLSRWRSIALGAPAFLTRFAESGGTDDSCFDTFTSAFFQDLRR